MLVVIDADGVPSVARMLSVAGSNLAPSVALTQPANGATFTAPATIGLAADASDPDGSVAKVEFFNGATKLGEDTAAPYTYTWTGVPAGTYSLTARATDDRGAQTTSSTRTVTVNAPTATPTFGNTAIGSGVRGGRRGLQVRVGLHARRGRHGHLVQPVRARRRVAPAVDAGDLPRRRAPACRRRS